MQFHPSHSTAGAAWRYALACAALLVALLGWLPARAAGPAFLVKDINPTVERQPYTYWSLYLLAGVGDQIFFMGEDGTTGLELWKSDGTAAGTALVREINPGPDGSHPDDATVIGD